MSTEPMTIDAAVESLLAPRESEVVSNEVEEVEVDERDTETEVDTEESEPEYEYSEDDENDEFEATDESDAEEVEEPRFTVKVDGKETAVTLDELRRGYSGQQKIQRGMQEAAEARKAAAEAAQRATQYEQQLTAIFQQVQQQGVLRQPEAPTRELYERDPLGYIEADIMFKEDMAAYQQQQAQLQQVGRLNQQQQQAQRQEVLVREAELARQKIPELSDAKRAPDYKNRLVDFGQNVLGYDVSELGNVSDHRALYTMHLARIGYEAMQGKEKAAVRTQKAKPVIKSGAKKVQDPKRQAQHKAKSQLKKTGSIEDALSLIMNS